MSEQRELRAAGLCARGCAYLCPSRVFRETKWTWSRCWAFPKADSAPDEPKTFWNSASHRAAAYRHFLRAVSTRGTPPPSMWGDHAPAVSSQGAFQVLTETTWSSASETGHWTRGWCVRLGHGVVPQCGGCAWASDRLWARQDFSLSLKQVWGTLLEVPANIGSARAGLPVAHGAGGEEATPGGFPEPAGQPGWMRRAWAKWEGFVSGVKQSWGSWLRHPHLWPER